MNTTIGGDRLGSGNKQQISDRNYERSTHDLSQVWRSSMAVGTLVPFMTELALPGDTFDIDLNAQVLTLPTIGPLFGNFKVQLDVFVTPIRIYNGAIMQNQLNIGLNMSQILLPKIHLFGRTPSQREEDIDNCQINPSCILSYLNIRGIMTNSDADEEVSRYFNGVPFINYWDIYKNYYANKQEETGVVIHTPVEVPPMQIIGIYLNSTLLPQNQVTQTIGIGSTSVVEVPYDGQISQPNVNEPYFVLNGIQTLLIDIFTSAIIDVNQEVIYYTLPTVTSTYTYTGWGVKEDGERPQLTRFDLSNIDDMRTALRKTDVGQQFVVGGTNTNVFPYLCINTDNGATNLADKKWSKQYGQEGLGIKTYQSDLFNNWISTEWIDGANGINAITSIDTSAGEFSLDTLNLSKKIYEMLNRIAVSGGTYDNWLDATYAHDRRTETQNPVYVGGLSKELTFQEVVSTTQSENQPLGTLAGRGVLTNKNKGGKITIRVDEPSYIMGIISITPRIDYSQGNKWDTSLQSFNDFHKPQLDEIGFQELITEQQAWWDVENVAGLPRKKSAGKQPAWVNYMTNVNYTRGNFAMKNKDMFMTLNRRYEPKYLQNGTFTIKDLTTYIDPTKYNFIFAETRLDAQNFWVQVAMDITARRKMSAKLMPNL